MQWNYQQKAVSLAEAIKSTISADAELIKGSKGVFDVTVNGEKIFSKDDTGRFPTNEEIVSQLLIAAVKQKLENETSDL